MTGTGAMNYLKGICDRIDAQTKRAIRTGVVVAALPVAATFTVACYGQPMEDIPEEGAVECSDGLDNDNDGSIDCEDSSCDTETICGVEICDDEFDNDGDGFVDCTDVDDCTGDPACI